MDLSTKTKEKIAIVLDISKTVFHWGFIPAVIYIGFKKGADPGMPELRIVDILWQ